MFSEAFYELNKAQHFPFPHSNCDEIETEELKRMFVSKQYILPHIIQYSLERYGVGFCPVEEVLERVQMHPYLQELGAGCMRLKFLAEVMDPVRMEPRLKKLPAKLLTRVPELQGIMGWGEHGTDRYHQIDVLTNRIFAYIVQAVESVVRYNEYLPWDNNDDLKRLFTHIYVFNRTLETVRERPCGEFVWKGVDPSELSLVPYFTFVLRAWNTLEVFGVQ